MCPILSPLIQHAQHVVLETTLAKICQLVAWTGLKASIWLAVRMQ